MLQSEPGKIYNILADFVTKLWPNDFEDIDQGQKLLCMTHPLILVIICTNYENQTHPDLQMSQSWRRWHNVP